MEGEASPAGRGLVDKAGRADGLPSSCSRRFAFVVLVVDWDGVVPGWGGTGRSQKGNREVAGCRMV
jgi:hypothetical protein